MQENFDIHPAYASQEKELRECLKDFASQGEFLVDVGRNHVKKIPFGNTTLVVKKFKTPSFFQGLVYRFLRKSKAKRSFEYARYLQEAGINTPKPIAYLENFSLGLKESYYVSEYVAYDLDFRVLNHNPRYPERDEILKEFTAFTFKLHENNVLFLDHSPGNTLIQKNADGSYSFYLIDLNRMKFKSLNLNERLKNFRRLWLSKKMISVMAPVYAGLVQEDPEKVSQLLLRYSRAFQKKVNSKKLRKRKRKH